MFHFGFDACDNSLYFAISSISPTQSGLELSGTIGDGSAEAWFEASLAGQMSVRLVPVWAPGEETLCQRYDQVQLEEALASALADLSIRSEGTFDAENGCWQQRFEATERRCLNSSVMTSRYGRPHPQINETGPIWQLRATG